MALASDNIINMVAEDLKRYIERIEKLELDKAEILENIRDVYAEAGKNAFDTKVMKQIVRLRKMDRDDLKEQEMLLDTYKHALGMIIEEDA